MELDLTSKCRVCLTEYKQMNYLFNEFDQGVTLQDILTNTTGIELEKDERFSSHICQNCTSVIVDFYNLKTIYEENEKHMRTLLEQSVSEKEESEVLEESSKGEDYITIKVESYASDDECSLNYDCQPETCYAEDAKAPEGAQNEDFEYQEINIYTCPECGDCFLYKNDIHNHMVSKHDTTEIDYDDLCEISLLKVKKLDQSITQTRCKFCSKIFDSEEACKEHIETHKKNVCDVCGVGFIKKSYLKDHQEVHCTEKRHVCSFCNKAFKRRTVLVKHRRIHTHPRQCICEICGKAFNDKGTLKTHISLLHVRERNYMCLICGVKFPLKGTLEKHIKRHQNKEREFFCSQCPLGYRDKSSLDRHVYVKHSGHNVKSTCNHCGKQYTTVGNLFKHQRNCHGGTVVACGTEDDT